MSTESTAVTLTFPDAGGVDLRCIELHGAERLGQASSFWVVAVSVEPVAAATLVGKGCVIVAAGPTGARAIRGTVTKFTALATTQDVRRTYRLEVRSSGALLGLYKRCRVFQHMTIPQVVQATLTNAGWPADRIKIDGVTGPAKSQQREYLIQYAETDEAFVRRICEDVGLYFRHELGPDGDVFALYDDSTSVQPTLPEPIILVDIAGTQVSTVLAAWRTTSTLQRRPGKVTLRDYDRTKPQLKLEGTATAGTDLEKQAEVYRAPGRFNTPADGTTRSQLALEALRAEAETLRFTTNALSISPGDAVKIEPGPGFIGPPATNGTFFVVALTHDWAREPDSRYVLQASFIPVGVPYRLPKVTPRPTIGGVHSALITGASGAEIHPDKDGCVFVKFHWDREGPTDNTSSLPVRVWQPNMPGSMNIPRVGWEVFVTFEDGDPDRPYVMGRAYNGKQVPPHALPANKTMTAVSTYSSPGGAAKNAFSFNDAAGAQLMSWHAGFNKNVTVANNQNIRVGHVEGEVIKGNQSRTVSGNETVSVGDGYEVEVGSQTATVGATQNCYVTGLVAVKTGSETVVVGGALLEKVGNPVKGVINLAVQAGIAGVGALGESIGGLAAHAAPLLGAAAGIGWGMYQAATAPGAGPNAARDAGIRGAIGAVAGHIPGGDALFSSISGTGAKFPWEKPPPGLGSAEPGGGAGASEGDGSGASGPGPGYRQTIVKGAMAEVLGGSNLIATPGDIKWQTSGAALIGVGGSHSTKAIAAATNTLGASFETLGSFHITTSSEAGRAVKGPVTTSISGSLKSKAGSKHSVKSDASVTIKVGGGLKIDGSAVVFHVGSSYFVSSPGGVLIKAGTITIKGKTKQDGKATHA